MQSTANISQEGKKTYSHRCNKCFSLNCTLRCSRCKNAWFCNQECQRKDWPFHKRHCHPQPEETRAWQEMQAHIINMPIEDAHQRFDMITDEIEKMKKKVKSANPDPVWSQQPLQDHATPQTKVTPSKPLLETNLLSIPVAKEKKLFPITDSRVFRYVVEETPNISCYQVILHFTCTNPPAVDVFITQRSKTSFVTFSSCDETIVILSFPVKLIQQETPVHFLDDSLYFRLQTEVPISPPFEQLISTSEEEANSMCCRACRQSLFHNTATVKRILPLPAGYWDEITDYLICYNGQPSIDFSLSSTHAQEGAILEDAAAMIVHKDDVGESICHLCVVGYGEDEKKLDFVEDDGINFRGERVWKDSVGGGTVCCTQCCTTLGFASLEAPETLRLLKHRLSTSHTFDDSFQRHSCDSFVAHEIIRYAESKAIFTFVVATASHKNCLLLHLLSWDTRLADSNESKHDAMKRDTLRFRRVVKVIYEETLDKAENSVVGSAAWNWGNLDLCCMDDLKTKAATNTTNSTGMTGKASVRLSLSIHEWNEFKISLLNGSNLFLAKEVVDTTIVLTLGKEKLKSSECIGLSALYIPF